MANILFRVSSTAPIPASTTVKNAPLTNIEVDGNFRSVNEDLANIVNVLLPLKANLASPDFTGTPTAPTATAGTNTTQVATTAFVSTATSSLAPKDSPVFTGTVTAETITASGTVTATDFNSTSDASLKENVQDLQHTAIDSVRPVAFNWKETGEKSYGVIAQELEAVFPELVKTDETGIKSVSYIPLIAMLVAKVQYLESEIEKLRA